MTPLPPRPGLSIGFGLSARRGQSFQSMPQGLTSLLQRLIVLVAVATPQTLCAELVWETLHRDLLTARGESSVSFDVRGVNDGTSRLQIESVTADCGCTRATVEPRTIAPGESTVLTVTIDTTKFAGARSLEVTIKTADSQYSQISAQVFVPGFGHFESDGRGWIPGGDRTPLRLNFHSEVGSTLHVERVDYDADRITLTAERPGPDSYEMEFVPLQVGRPFQARVFVWAGESGTGRLRMHTAILRCEAEPRQADDSVEGEESPRAATHAPLSTSRQEALAETRGPTEPTWLVRLVEIAVLAVASGIVALKIAGWRGATLIVMTILIAALVGPGALLPTSEHLRSRGPIASIRPEPIATSTAGSATILAGPHLQAQGGWSQDIGEINPLRPACRTFPISNAGDRELTLGAGRRSSGQVVAKSPGRLGPGKSGNVTLEFAGSPDRRAQHHFVEFLTNDPRLPSVTFHVHGYLPKSGQKGP